MECNELEIDGKLLVPGFSIYLLRITHKGNKFFYIGMTGDPYYPSARSAFHRISGHLELNKRSTQNRLYLALQNLGIYTEADLKKLKIKMYHFPIEGFKKWPHDNMRTDTIKKCLNTHHYKSYKQLQKNVCSLENALIMNLKNDVRSKERILNETKGKKSNLGTIPFPEIYNKITNIVLNV